MCLAIGEKEARKVFENYNDITDRGGANLAGQCLNALSIGEGIASIVEDLEDRSEDGDHEAEMLLGALEVAAAQPSSGRDP